MVRICVLYTFDHLNGRRGVHLICILHRDRRQHQQPPKLTPPLPAPQTYHRAVIFPRYFHGGRSDATYLETNDISFIQCGM